MKKKIVHFIPGKKIFQISPIAQNLRKSIIFPSFRTNFVRYLRLTTVALKSVEGGHVQNGGDHHLHFLCEAALQTSRPKRNENAQNKQKKRVHISGHLAN